MGEEIGINKVWSLYSLNNKMKISIKIIIKK